MYIFLGSYSSHNDYITKKKFIVTNLGLIIVAKIKNSLLPCAPPSYWRPFYRDRKGSVTQNCLFACSLALKFIYALTGWEGTGTDALLWQDALEKGLLIPEGKYLLGEMLRGGKEQRHKVGGIEKDVDKRVASCTQVQLYWLWMPTHLLVGPHYSSQGIKVKWEQQTPEIN